MRGGQNGSLRTAGVLIYGTLTLGLGIFFALSPWVYCAFVALALPLVVGQVRSGSTDRDSAIGTVLLVLLMAAGFIYHLVGV